LVSKIADPRFGKRTFTVMDQRFSEPDPQLFEVVKDFNVQTYDRYVRGVREASPAFIKSTAQQILTFGSGVGARL
jgi:hypothetical protein